MKYLLVVALLLGSTAQAADILPAGRYTGTGKLALGNGKVVPFSIQSTVTDRSNGQQTMVDTYTFADGTQGSHQYDITVDAYGKLLVYRNMVLSGKGYCVETSCHMNYSFADTQVSGEETLVVSGRHIERVGSRTTLGQPTHYAKTSLDKID